MSDATTDRPAQRIQAELIALNTAADPGTLSRCWINANDVAAQLVNTGKFTPHDWAAAMRVLRAAWQARRSVLGQ